MNTTNRNKPLQNAFWHPHTAEQATTPEHQPAWNWVRPNPEPPWTRRILWVLALFAFGATVLPQVLAQQCIVRYESVDMIRHVKRANTAEIFDLVFEAIGDRTASEKASIRVDGARLDDCGKPNARSLEPRTQSSRTNVGSATTSWLRNMTNAQGRSKP